MKHKENIILSTCLGVSEGEQVLKHGKWGENANNQCNNPRQIAVLDGKGNKDGVKNDGI